MMLMALIQLSRMLGGIFREPIWGLVSHPVCQPRCFRAPSMWQQAGVRLAGRLAGWQGSGTVTAACDKERSRGAADGTRGPGDCGVKHHDL